MNAVVAELFAPGIFRSCSIVCYNRSGALESHNVQDAIVLVCAPYCLDKSESFQKRFIHKLNSAKYLYFVSDFVGISSCLKEMIFEDEKMWNRAFQPNVRNFIRQYLWSQSSYNDKIERWDALFWLLGFDEMKDRMVSFFWNHPDEDYDIEKQDDYEIAGFALKRKREFDERGN